MSERERCAECGRPIAMYGGEEDSPGFYCSDPRHPLLAQIAAAREEGRKEHNETCVVHQFNSIRNDKAVAVVVDALKEENQRLRAKLRRVADWLKSSANSPSGIVAEIEVVLKQEEESHG